MFCPNCGKTVNGKLKYCNGCGERLANADDKEGVPGKMLNNVLTTLFLIVMFGLGILIPLVAVLLGNGVRQEGVLMIATIYLLVLFGICFTLVRQVPKLIDAKLKHPNGYVDMTTPQFQPRNTAQLDEYREPVMSVTDHTTRILDKVPTADR